MRHGIAGNRLNRKSSHRKATLRDLAKATLAKQRICTTLTKAKEARKLVDQLITLGKKGTLAHKRRAYSILCDHRLVSELFRRTSTRFKDRQGGYTRIIPLGQRKGDNAQLAFLELTEKDEVIVTKPKSTVLKKKERVKAKDAASQESGAREDSGSKIDFTKVSEGQTSDQKVSGTVKKEAEIQEDTKKEEKRIKPGPKQKKPQDQGKPKPTNKIVGGLKNFFRRKSSGK